MQQIQGRIFQQLEINVASPKEILLWAQRFIPNGEIIGEVTSWETVNYKTLKPEPNGLFCQKIFGPVIDYTCACGKKAVKLHTGFCPKCGVERTTSQVRRYRMGYIRLKQPVAHTLYASQKPSPLGSCLNWPNKKLQAVLYGTEFCYLPDSFMYLSHTQMNERKWAQVLWSDSFVEWWDDLYPPEKKPTPTPPRLFRKKSSRKSHSSVFFELYSNNRITFNIPLYGVSYDMAWRKVEDFQNFLVYIGEQPGCTDALIPHYAHTNLAENYSSPSKSIPRHNQYYPIQTGGFVFQKLLSHYDLIGLQRQLALDLAEVKRTLVFLFGKIQRVGLEKEEKAKLQIEISRFKKLRKKLLRRLTYFRDFYKAKTQPAWMILSYLPVLPPGLRPITSIRGELVVSDLNSLYRKVLTRNRRLTNATRFSIFDTALPGSWASWCYNLRQVQESVDSLLKTGKIESGKTTKSLLDTLKGKRGRFRQHLLGKRVDYSGRSVIVVGPELQIHECGLPKKMAVELFQPFLIQRLRNKGIASTTTGAKAIITDRKPIIWTLLSEIFQSHPILLNRAPTLHRLGIQAFVPKLVNGKAILLHPLVCPAFNADFDGDQMAVHVPLSPAARSEAFNLLLARNNLLAPSSGQPLLLPTQDMILGCYYLTISKEKNELLFSPSSKPIFRPNTTNIGKWYSHIDQIVQDYQNNRVQLHTPIWLFWSGCTQNLMGEQQSQEQYHPCEIRCDSFGNTEFIFMDKYVIQSKPFLDATGSHKKTIIRTTPGRVLLHTLIDSAMSK